MSKRSSRQDALRPLLLLVAGVALCITPARAEPGTTIRLNPPGERRAAFEVAGIAPDVVAAMARGEFGPDQWSALFAVYSVPADVTGTQKLPPILGTYRVEAGLLRFQPRFPLEPGLVYRARFDPSKLPNTEGATVDRAALEAEFTLPKKLATPTTLVTTVYPTRDTLPDNLLKFYLHFSAPMGRGATYEHIHLRDVKGKDLVFPFLELGEELWDRSGRRLTLLFDPGRIKTGLKPREELGPILSEGGIYTLVIDCGWLDAEGQPLASEYRRTFRAGPADNEPPDPKTWRMRVPDPGTRDALVLTFPEPLDRAMIARVITIQDAQGHTLPGEIAVEAEETRWLFTPDLPWGMGEYRVAVSKDLEDLAGNSIGRPFEVDVFDKVERQSTAETVTLPFRIGRSTR